MGALTGNTVQSTYLDLVQLGKSGSGLPSHAGKEAALYDGSGAQILGRTAVRHWLDPHPDAAAFAETWEFSTKGDMTQAQLEAAGWTFVNMTGEVSGGILWLTADSTAGAQVRRAYITTSLDGDFDIMAKPVSPFDYADHEASSPYSGAVYVEDTVNDVAHGIERELQVQGIRCYDRLSGTSTSLQGSGFSETWFLPPTLRIQRISGTVYVCVGHPPDSRITPDDTAPHTYSGWTTVRTVADGDTYQRITLALRSSAQLPSVEKVGFYFLRRFQ